MKIRDIIQLPRFFFVLAIRVYQRTLSFDHGPLGKLFFPHGFCRFQPTCSEYGAQAILKYGILRGGLKTAWRVIRCNPWSKGGPDPVA
ncbi:MAG: membrane protein insertion efficiency factor YidD [Patescibacteria group bacterium]